MHKLLPVSWARNGVRLLRCTICCRCLGLEAGSECKDAEFVAGVVGSKRRPNASMSKLLPVSWARSGVGMLRCTICYRRLRLESDPDAKMYDLLPVEAGSECQDIRLFAGVLGSKRGPGAKMYDLLPVSWDRSGVRMLRCTTCCRCLGLDVESMLRCTY